MRKPVLILSPDPDIYGSYRGAEAEIHKHVYKLIVGGITPEHIQELYDALESGEVSTVITRGLWYNYLLESEYLRTHPRIHVDQLIVDTRVMISQLSQFSESGFKKIGMISINSPYGFDPPDITSMHKLGDITVRKFCIFDISNPMEALDDFLKDWDCDLLYGDINNLPISNLPCVPFKVRSKTLRAMILNAVNYDNSLYTENQQQNLFQFLQVMTNTVSESIVVFDVTGAIRANNMKSLKTFSCESMSGRSIEELLHMTIAQIRELPSNALLSIHNREYIANLLSYSQLPNENVFVLSLSSVSNIETTELSIRTQMARRGYQAQFSFDDIFSRDPASTYAKATAEKYAHFNETILITGETGSGKELYASAIHNSSPRKNGPFVAINCAALSESLIESELFGYEKGAFTGALSSGHKGLFEQAHRGTIFLDEIGEIPSPLQSKLLRALQEKRIRRIGGNEVIPVDVRVIAATNRDLYAMCEQGGFRRDLYYRLSVLDLHIPPLRERKRDIVPLFQHFINRYAEEYKYRIYWEDDSIFDELIDYGWPGNVRELENVAMRTVILAENRCLTPEDLHRGLVQRSLPTELTPPQFSTELIRDLDDLNRAYIEYLLDRMSGNQARVCEYLGISRSTLWRKLHPPKG